MLQQNANCTDTFFHQLYIVLKPKEVAATVPDSDKTLAIESFIPCSEIDTVYFDKPYYLTLDKMGTEAYVREDMKKAKAAAIARTVLFRRLRAVLIRSHGKGLITSTLNFDYKVRSSQAAFEDQPDVKSDPELLKIAELIIEKKKGSFDASTFNDQYEEAVTELVKAKIEGRSLLKKKAAPAAKAVDLLQALRESAGLGAKKTKSSRTAATANAGTGNSRTKKAAGKAKAAAAPTRRAG